MPPSPQSVSIQRFVIYAEPMNFLTFIGLVIVLWGAFEIVMHLLHWITGLFV